MAESQVKLHGNWSSVFVYPVIWALKLKGVEYEYVHEHLSSLSPTLLEYNPVHKKVPVLVHNGKPVAESPVILEYIDETWPGHQLLPADPYERAVARFWSDYATHKMPTFSEFYLCSEEDKEKTAERVLEKLKIIQDQALGDKRFFGGDRIGLVDLRFGWLTHWFAVIEEIVGVQVLEPNTLPRLHEWMMNFKQNPVIKDNLPDYDALLAFCTNVKLLGPRQAWAIQEEEEVTVSRV